MIVEKFGRFASAVFREVHMSQQDAIYKEHHDVRVAEFSAQEVQRRGAESLSFSVI
jgi:hypothetical protein